MPEVFHESFANHSFEIADRAVSEQVGLEIAGLS